MNPVSLNGYWHRQVEPLLLAVGPLAGKTLRYVHTDSWEGGGMNWSPDFDQAFQQSRGYDPIPWLAVLAGHVVESRASSNAFLADFRKTIGDRVADHYEQLATLARRHALATHPECSGPHAGPLDGLKELWSQRNHDERVLVAITTSTRIDGSIFCQASRFGSTHIRKATGRRRRLYDDRSSLER